jgi:RNA polymerase sigma factor (sigma-70 family)
MTELDDQELLGRYARDESDAAFATLVARYVNLVYSAALRFTDNPHHAEEIAQAVFIILARKASRLRHDTVLSGWLYQTARLTAANFVKGEIRRQRREQEVYMQSTLMQPESAAWEQIAPFLDEALGSLSETDRNAIVLRFFENKPIQEIAVKLRLNQAAAHKRVTRALEKLRRLLLRRGVAFSATAIGGAVAANSVQAAPAELAVTVTAAAVKGAAVGGSTLALINGTLKTMAWIKASTAVGVGIGALLILGAGIGGFEKIHKSRAWSEGLQAKDTYAGTTQISVTGTTGAVFTGFYVQDGQKTAVSNSVPWSFVGARVSSLEFHKVDRADTVLVSLRYDGEGMHATAPTSLDHRWLWMRVRVENGLITERFSQ